MGLTARALGADRLVLSGERDEGMLSSLYKVTRDWGGEFEVVYERDWKAFMKAFTGIKVHLTMYGLPVEQVIGEVRERNDREDLLIVVGAGKVPRLVYQLADFNVSVTSQPHSEVSSLAIFLDRLHAGRELNLQFHGARKKIVPSARGKHVEVDGGGRATS